MPPKPKNGARDKALKFLKSHYGGVLSTLSPENKPQSAYMYYATDKDLNFYFLTKASTRKFKNIQNRADVAFVIADEEALDTIQGEGTAKEVKSIGEKTTAFGLLIEVLSKKMKQWPPPVGKIQTSDLVILKVTPSWLRWGDFDKKTGFGGDECFTQLIP